MDSDELTGYWIPPRVRTEREIRSDTIDECIEKLYEVTPQTADQKLDMVFVNALKQLKGE